MKFYRKANPLPMVFRLAGIHVFYVLPWWFIVDEFSAAALPRLLRLFFSTLIVLLVALIRLRRFLNEKTARQVEAATQDDVVSGEVEIEQSFDYREYLRLNLEVMFSYLRPYLSIAAGLVFVVSVFLGVSREVEPIKVVLAVMLSFYFLALPWFLFFSRTRRVYSRNRPLLLSQKISFRHGTISVRAGDTAQKDIHQLEDIAVTRHFLLLFTAGTNYIQVSRSDMSDDSKARILGWARLMISDE